MINFKKTILLTGAGFSKNFGGYLGREMWAKIFNNPDIDAVPGGIRPVLRNNFDFESVYADVLADPNLKNEEKKKFESVIISAYDDMDRMLGQYNYTGSDPYQINFHSVSKLLGLFAGTGGSGDIGVHFTLNQDLFMEKKLQRKSLGLVTAKYGDYAEAINNGRINSKLKVALPDENFINEFQQKHMNSAGDLFYIKLHGSSGWFSADGSNRMILGNNKLFDIMKEPLLKWYLNIFEQVLNQGDVRLFVIGYGFRDSHINQYVVKAIKEHGLKIFVISPNDPEDLKNRLIGKPNSPGQIWEQNQDGLTIWNALVNYYPYSLKEIFPSDQSDTDIKDDLFNAIKNT